MGRRRKFINAVMVVLAGSLVAGTAMAQEKIKVATTIGMVADLVKQVGSDRVEVDQLMGPGIDPHLYKPTSTDASRLSKADVIFYSGLMLEGRMGDLFVRLARAGKKVYATTESVPERPLERAEGVRRALRSAHLVRREHVGANRSDDHQGIKRS
jgi:manganese/zinc/iron transport system substrate-binding protein